MDRRQLLTGLVAMGVVGFLLRYRGPKPSAPQSCRPSPGAAHDPETRELLGPVKKCIEEGPGGVTTYEYGPDRKLLRSRIEHDGKIVYDSLQSSFSETRDAQGRLLSQRWPMADGTFGENFYEYDKAG